MKKSKASPNRKSIFGAFLGASLVALSGIIILVAVSMDRQPFLAKVTEFNMSSETHRKIFTECLALHKQLDELKYPHSFKAIEINLIDPLPAKQQIASALSSCLTKSAKSPYSLQGEVFSSEYEGKDGDVIVLQLNFFDKTGNKVMELNHHWTTSEFQPSQEPEPPAESNRSEVLPRASSDESKATTSAQGNGSFKEIRDDASTDLEQKIK